MLTMRQRGKARIFYIRGKVTLRDQWVDVPEYSTGTNCRDAAAHVMAKHEQELREQLMFGPKAKAASATVSDALVAYLQKPARPNSSDIIRVGVLDQRVGTYSLASPLIAWKAFREGYLLGHAPAGQDRYRSVLQAAINVYHKDHGLPEIKIPTISFKNTRIRFLSPADRDKLIAAYVPHVRPIIVLLAYQGARTQEALQLIWGAGGADMKRKMIFFPETKNGEPRSVPMHPKVKKALLPLWKARGEEGEHVFLNRLGNPYQDTRDAPIQGGNPLKSAHRTACKKASIPNFTVHDWRHHWASHCVMAGVDLNTIQRLGGWKSLRMVERYAAVDSSHMRSAVLKLR